MIHIFITLMYAIALLCCLPAATADVDGNEFAAALDVKCFDEFVVAVAEDDVMMYDQSDVQPGVQLDDGA